MDVISQIRKPVAQELEDYKAFFHFSLNHSNPLLERALQHVTQRRGKMMRPLLVLLFSKLHGSVASDALHAAVSFEMLHTASLVHDDVVDDSNKRRGQLSVNASFGNKVAVLLGDFMLSTALQHAALTNDNRVVELIALLGQTLSDGELLQLFSTESQDISEAVYFEVIRKKTAILFATCSQTGALLGGASTEQIEKARLFGEYIGLIFQIRDDIFDYFDVSEIGKPTGNDMKEGKLTLPVIYAVTQPGAGQAYQLALKIRAKKASGAEITDLMEYTKQNGGIEYAQSVMEDFRKKALSILAEYSNSELADSLRLYVDFVASRSL